MQTYKNVLHVYGMHSSKEAVLSTSLALGGPSSHLEFKRGDIYLQQSQVLRNGGATASELVGDSRSLLLGFSDGSLQLFSWQAKASPLQCQMSLLVTVLVSSKANRVSPVADIPDLPDCVLFQQGLVGECSFVML